MTDDIRTIPTEQAEAARKAREERLVLIGLVCFATLVGFLVLAVTLIGGGAEL